MQADRQSMQSTNHMYCPLCHAPLDYRTSDEAIGITGITGITTITSEKDSYIFCASCGFSAPFVPRQHSSRSRPIPRQSPTPAPVRQQSPVSVWVDSTISPYPQEKQALPESQPSDAPARPVPPRASARRQRSHAVNVHARYPYARVQPTEEDDLSRLPTMPPPTTWEYESQEYTAESSLSSLSLIVDTPTSPHIEGPTATNVLNAPTPTVPQTPYLPETPPHGMPRIEDMDTHPPAGSTASAAPVAPVAPDESVSAQKIADVATRPQTPGREIAVRRNSAPLPGASLLFPGLTGLPEIPSESLASPISPEAPTRAMIPSTPTSLSNMAMQQYGQATSEASVSWTAGAGAGSPYARRLVAHEYERRHLASFNVLDRLRWWLLHPGRFEFLLWLTGMLLLVVVTCIFVLMTVFAFQPGANHSSAGHSRSDSAGSIAYETPAGPVLSSIVGVVSTGQPLHLRGQGFSVNAEVALSYDANQAFLDQQRQPVIAHTNGQGIFSVTVNSPAWGAGKHRIVARDMVTGHVATTMITATIASSPAASTPTVAATATQSTGTSGSTSPPANQTPISSPPTVSITPTATPKPPTPTPTTGITPTATTGITPTVGATTTPGINGTVTGTVTGNNSLNAQSIITSGPTMSGSVAGGPWLWFMIAGYALAMVLLGCAGFVRRR